MWKRILLVGLLAAESSLAGEHDMSANEKLAAGVLEKARADGVVRVIVKVQPSDASVGTNERNARGFCENVDCARALVGQVLTADMASNVKDISESLLAMDVTPEGLEALEQIPLVQHVSFDAVSDPVPGQEGGSDGCATEADDVEPQPDDLPPDLSAPQ